MLMAVDTGVALGPAALFAALSRGGTALLSHAGQTNSSLGGLAPASKVLSAVAPVTQVAASSAPLAAPSTDEVDTTLVLPAITDTLRAPLAAIPATQTLEAEGEPGDVSIQIGAGTNIIYNATSGVVRVDTSTALTTLEIVSKSGIFTRSPATNLSGPFDIDSDTKLFKLDANGFSSLSFGPVAQLNLTEAFIRQDLVISGSPLGGGVLSNKPIRVTVDMTNLSGAVITEANVGDEFLMRVRVKDTRPTSLIPAGQAGVFSTYLDVTYDAALADAVGSLVFNDKFNTATSGTLTDGLLDEIGAISSQLSPTGATEQTIITLRMKAQKAGALKFSADGPDLLPAHEVLLYGSTAAIPATDINFETKATLNIVDNSPKSDDLVAFAKALTQSGAKFYGAYWCPHCTATKELFEDGQNYLPYVEVTNPDRTPNQVAIDNNIESYPTWVFANGTRLEGQQTLQAISTASGVAIPQGNSPYITAIPDKGLLDGSPLFVPLDGWDPNDGPLTYEVTIDNPALLTAAIPQGNRSMQIDVNGFGKMLFQLFDDKAPRVTEQMTTLADEDFYDGLTFHRVLNDFVIQGGDPNGNGTGGSDLPDFDDQFHVDLQHNQTGLLSMAKSADDTNNSQFFVTEGPTRWLDFNHSIWGMLIEGEKNRDNISNVKTNTSGVPTITITMDSVDVVQDVENSLVMLKAVPGATGSANVTVKVRDAEGHEAVDTFAVNITPDTINGGPFLNDIPPLSTSVDTPLDFQLTSQDVEGDAVQYSGINGTNLTLEVNATTGAVRATPKAGFVGTATATVRVRPATTSNTQDPYDSQLISVEVLPKGPTSVDLLDASDTGFSNTDNLTNASQLVFRVEGVTSGALVELLADGEVIGEASALGNSVIITSSNLSALGDGAYEITAVQYVNDVASAESPVLVVTLDQTPPPAFTSTPPTTGVVGTAITYDAQNPEEGDDGFRYSLQDGPQNAQLNATTGVLNWTPSSAQSGVNAFSIVAADAAGNTRAQALSVDVESIELMRYRLQVSNGSGNAIDALATGQDFQLQVFVQDLRDDSVDLRGVFSAYLDVNYPASKVQVTGPINFAANYANARFGSTTNAGVIDDAGATAGTNPLGEGEQLLFSVPMKAVGGGSITFTSDPADETPLLDTTLFGLSTALRAEQMTFGSVSLQVADKTFAVDDEFNVFEDSSNSSLSVLANDIGVPAGVALSITAVSTPSHGTATRSTDNQRILYTPTANYTGSDEFTYTITDANGNSSTATVRMTVANTNDPPVALDDAFTIAEDAQAASLNVLANDSTGSDTSETLTITATGTPEHGTVSISADKKALNYTPTANYFGTDSFTYTIEDGNGGTATARVNLTITEVNDAPVTVADVRTTPEDTPLTIPASVLTANDSPGPNESSQTLTVIEVKDATQGATVVLNGTNITVTPATNFVGSLSFKYVVRDNGTTNGQPDPRTAEGTVTVNVTSVNDVPTAVNDTASMQLSTGSILIDVLANDSSSPDTGETLTIASVGTTSNGGTAVIETGKIRYTPKAAFTGTETFNYTISDGNGGQSTATVTVTVQNYVPGGVSGFIFVDSNRDGVRNTGEKALTYASVLLTGTDSQGQAVSRTSVTDSEGKYTFGELIPGAYKVSQVQPSFTVDGSTHVDGEAPDVTSETNSFSFDLTPEGVDGVFMNFAERGLEPKFSIWDALASSSRDGFHVSVNKTTGQEWNRIDRGWVDVTITDVRFNADQSALTITIREAGKTLASTVQRSDRTRVQIIGQEGDSSLIRIRGARADFTFTEVTT